MKVGNINLDAWVGKFPRLFEKAGSYKKSEFLKKLKVCHKEIAWKTQPEDTPSCNTGVTYDEGEVSDEEALRFVERLEDEEVVSRVQTEERSFFNPIMFLKKVGSKGVWKVVDF